MAQSKVVKNYRVEYGQGGGAGSASLTIYQNGSCFFANLMTSPQVKGHIHTTGCRQTEADAKAAGEALIIKHLAPNGDYELKG